MDIGRIHRATAWRDQPSGLWVLAGTELWDRISFYGMQALLMLYMTGWLLRPEHAGTVVGLRQLRGAIETVSGAISTEALAAQIMGLYVSFIFLMPIFGGLIGDRLIGRRAAVTIGAVAMTCGHLALVSETTFLLGLVLLVSGVGLLRGNISAQLKALYTRDDPREHSGFQIYYAALNIGAFVAPLITGLLVQRIGWRSGFGFAGLGMVIGMFIYVRGAALLPPDAMTETVGEQGDGGIVSWRASLALLSVWPLLICYWFAQSQVWNVYNLWVRDHVVLNIGGFQIPVPWLQSLDGIAPLLLLPICMIWWRNQAAQGRARDNLGRMTSGSCLLSGSMFWLAAASLVGAGGRVSLIWPLVFHAMSSLAGLFFIPTALALFAGTGSSRSRATMIGFSMTAGFVAGILSGRFGGLYGALDPATFWALHAVIAAVPAIALKLVANRLRTMLAPTTGRDRAGRLYTARSGVAAEH